MGDKLKVAIVPHYK